VIFAAARPFRLWRENCKRRGIQLRPLRERA